MLNAVWIGMLVVAVVCGAISGRMADVARATTESAGTAVTLALGLVGVMSFWLGTMRVLHQAGLLAFVSRLMARPMRWLFPEVPADHPAIPLMIMNMTTNMLGLGNAATPFGLKAMQALDQLNPKKGTASNAMALFLAVNTSGLAVLPTGMMAVRASLGSRSAGAIVVPTLIATMCATTVAILSAKLFQRFSSLAGDADGTPAPAATLAAAGSTAAVAPAAAAIETPDMGALIAVPPLVRGWRRLVALAVTLAVLAAGIYGIGLLLDGPAGASGLVRALGGGARIGSVARTLVSTWVLPVLLMSIVLVGVWRGVKIYDCVVEGGKEGFALALRIMPYLVAILVAVGMLRASGAIDLMVGAVGDVTMLVGMPAEALPMALLRPLSGSGSLSLAAELMKTHGPDSFLGNVVSTMYGSSETTFYVLALYFGSVGVRRGRHTLLACLCSEAAGVLASVWTVRFILGS